MIGCFSIFLFVAPRQSSVFNAFLLLTLCTSSLSNVEERLFESPQNNTHTHDPKSERKKKIETDTSYTQLVRENVDFLLRMTSADQTKSSFIIMVDFFCGSSFSQPEMERKKIHKLDALMMLYFTSIWWRCFCLSLYIKRRVYYFRTVVYKQPLLSCKRNNMSPCVLPVQQHIE